MSDPVDPVTPDDEAEALKALTAHMPKRPKPGEVWPDPAEHTEKFFAWLDSLPVKDGDPGSELENPPHIISGGSPVKNIVHKQ